MKKELTIAIDGPAGAGKSTIAKEVAKYFGIFHIDTGAMYRAISLYLLENNIDISNESQVEKSLDNITLKLLNTKQKQDIILNGKILGESIRTQIVGETASIISTYILVREKMVRMQKDIAKNTSLVMDGRDIGTHVLTNATIKIYLSADATIRGERRKKQLLLQGKELPIESIITEINKRDYMDKTRKYSPLRQAEDAIFIDTSNLEIDEVVDKIIGFVKEK